MSNDLKPPVALDEVRRFVRFYGSAERRLGGVDDDSPELDILCEARDRAYLALLAAIARQGAAVPEEPTEAMLNAARDWSVKKYGLGIGNDAAKGCWAAMYKAAAISQWTAAETPAPRQDEALRAAAQAVGDAWGWGNGPELGALRDALASTAPHEHPDLPGLRRARDLAVTWRSALLVDIDAEIARLEAKS